MESVKNYILFPSHTEGMKLSSLLDKSGIKYIISPTPRQLSTSCGISIIFDMKDINAIKKIIDENGVNIAGIESLKFEKKNFYI